MSVTEQQTNESIQTNSSANAHKPAGGKNCSTANEVVIKKTCRCFTFWTGCHCDRRQAVIYNGSPNSITDIWQFGRHRRITIQVSSTRVSHPTKLFRASRSLACARRHADGLVWFIERGCPGQEADKVTEKGVEEEEDFGQTKLRCVRAHPHVWHFEPTRVKPN